MGGPIRSVTFGAGNDTVKSFIAENIKKSYVSKRKNNKSKTSTNCHKNNEGHRSLMCAFTCLPL